MNIALPPQPLSQRHPFIAAWPRTALVQTMHALKTVCIAPTPNHSQLSNTRLPSSPSLSSPPWPSCPPFFHRPSGAWNPGAGTAAPSPATTAAFARSWPAASRAARHRSPWTGGWCASAFVTGTLSGLVRVWVAFRVGKTEELVGALVGRWGTTSKMMRDMERSSR